MTWLQGILLGLVQGITEIFPISSDGHLALLLIFYKIPEAVRLNLTAALHLGTALAILLFMFNRVKNILTGMVHPDPVIRKDNRQLVLFIIIGSLPAVIAGTLLEKPVTELFSAHRLIGIFFFLNGILLFLTRFTTPDRKRLNLFRTLLIGLIQATAILPAISRSGTTISLALLLGINRTQAFEFSFLLALPITLGAAAFELLKIDFSQLSLFAVVGGIVVAGVTGFLMLVALRRLIVTRNFYLFGIYCWLIGILTLIILS